MTAVIYARYSSDNQLEETKRELEARIAEEKLAKPKVT